MTIALAHRLQGFHALLKMVPWDDRTVADIKKKKPAVKDRLAVLDGRQKAVGSR